MEKIKNIMESMPRDQRVKNGIMQTKEKKRKSLTFSELTDVVVENGIFSVEDLWQVAKARKMSGDDSLWNRMGEERCMRSTLQKILKGWHGNPTSTLRCSSKYTTSDFDIPPVAVEWMATGFHTRTLVLAGRGGIGKTSLASALLLQVCKRYHFITRLDELKQIDFVPGTGLLWDEACCSHMQIDEIKNVLDLEHSRVVKCRNVDGVIAAQTPRIYCSNHSPASFFGCLPMEHLHAVNRRHTWLEMTQDCRKAGPVKSQSMTCVGPSKHNVFRPFKGESEQDFFG